MWKILLPKNDIETNRDNNDNDNDVFVHREWTQGTALFFIRGAYLIIARPGR